MKVLTDSSALAKRYVLEVGSDEIDRFLQNATQLGLCAILIPEVLSGLNRRRRENNLSDDDYRAIKTQLMEDVHDAVILQITPAVISHSIKLLESNVLRAMDALHIACALEWKAELFVTADRRLRFPPKSRHDLAKVKLKIGDFPMIFCLYTFSIYDS